MIKESRHYKIQYRMLSKKLLVLKFKKGRCSISYFVQIVYRTCAYYRSPR